MFFDEMKKTENTEEMWTYWEKYRERLTEAIISQTESFHIKKELENKKSLRLSGNIDGKQLIIKNKPTLAIWGAGNCSDIDVERLSQYFQLVLIDCEMDKINKVSKDKSFFNGCKCIDLKFWDVSDEDYHMLEAMLIDGLDVASIGEHLTDLCDKMHSYDYESFNGFDYSVVVGLASQLNARFMALLDMYSCDEKVRGLKVKKIYSKEEKLYLAGVIDKLNKKAVDIMFELVEKLTGNLIFYGYEATVEGDMDILEQLSHDINHHWVEEREIGDLVNWIACNRTSIMGACELEDRIMGLLKDVSYNALFDFQSLVWNFMPGKNYLMLIFTLEKKGYKFLAD